MSDASEDAWEEWVNSDGPAELEAELEEEFPEAGRHFDERIARLLQEPT